MSYGRGVLGGISVGDEAGVDVVDVAVHRRPLGQAEGGAECCDVSGDGYDRVGGADR